MKTDIISIDNKGKGFKEAIEVTKVAAQFKDLKEKDSIKLQLCTEELLSMARSITGEMEGTFWVECDDEKFELTLSTQTVMDKEKRQTLISASSNKRNEAATSFLGMLRDSFEQAMLADRRIRDNTELLEKQMDTLRIVYEHNAISEDEYNSSMAVLERQLMEQKSREVSGEKLSDIIGKYRNAGSAISA